MDKKEQKKVLFDVHQRLNEFPSKGLEAAKLLVAIADAIATVHNAIQEELTVEEKKEE